MVSLNKVILVGNLTRDPELRYIPSGTAVVTLRIASNTSFKDKSGELRKDTCFINIIVWGQMAENCNQYLQKGRSILVEGRLVSRSWKDNEGKTRNVIEIRASRVQFMPQRTKEPSENVDLGDVPESAENLNNNTANFDSKEVI